MTAPRKDRTVRPLTLAAATALALAVLAGCQLGPRPVAGVPPSGDYGVVGVRPGDGPVRDPQAAMAAYGHLIRFGEEAAVSGQDVCRRPRYLVHDIVADHYLRGELGLRHHDLGLRRWQDVRISEVYCEGKTRWRALGGTVLWVDPTLGFAVRDDVLYEIRPTAAR
jgi:hypothetical protein